MARVKEVAARQTPFAAFLGCADSRVPIEILFERSFRDSFVTHVAGNLANNEKHRHLEFRTSWEQKVLYVLRHTSCGAVTATLRGGEAPGQIRRLFQHSCTAAKRSRGDLTIACKRTCQSGPAVTGMRSPGDGLVSFWPHTSRMPELEKRIIQVRGAFLNRSAVLADSLKSMIARDRRMPTSTFAADLSSLIWGLIGGGWHCLAGCALMAWILWVIPPFWPILPGPMFRDKFVRDGRFSRGK